MRKWMLLLAFLAVGGAARACDKDGAQASTKSCRPACGEGAQACQSGCRQSRANECAAPCADPCQGCPLAECPVCDDEESNFDGCRPYGACGDDDMQRGQLYFFTASWCGPCEKMCSVVGSRGVKKQLARFWRLKKVDIDESCGLAKRFGVKSVPAFVCVSPCGTVEKFTGYTPRTGLLAKLKKAYRRFVNEGEWLVCGQGPCGQASTCDYTEYPGCGECPAYPSCGGCSDNDACAYAEPAPGTCACGPDCPCKKMCKCGPDCPCKKMCKCGPNCPCKKSACGPNFSGNEFCAALSGCPSRLKMSVFGGPPLGASCLATVQIDDERTQIFQGKLRQFSPGWIVLEDSQDQSCRWISRKNLAYLTVSQPAVTETSGSTRFWDSFFQKCTTWWPFGGANRQAGWQQTANWSEVGGQETGQPGECCSGWFDGQGECRTPRQFQQPQRFRPNASYSKAASAWPRRTRSRRAISSPRGDFTRRATHQVADISGRYRVEFKLYEQSGSGAQRLVASPQLTAQAGQKVLIAMDDHPIRFQVRPDREGDGLLNLTLRDEQSGKLRGSGRLRAGDWLKLRWKGSRRGASRWLEVAIAPQHPTGALARQVSATEPVEPPTAYQSASDYYTVVYSVAHLIDGNNRTDGEPSIRPVIQKIKQNVSPRSWRHAEARIHWYQPSQGLVIRQTATAHQQISEYLQSMRCTRNSGGCR